jgi:hypothetical protein
MSSAGMSFRKAIILQLFLVSREMLVTAFFFTVLCGSHVLLPIDTQVILLCMEVNMVVGRRRIENLGIFFLGGHDFSYV